MRFSGLHSVLDDDFNGVSVLFVIEVL